MSPPGLLLILRIRPAGRGIRQATKGAGPPERWLPAKWPSTEPEPVQYGLSSLPSGMPLASLVRLAKLRRRIEHDYRETARCNASSTDGIPTTCAATCCV